MFSYLANGLEVVVGNAHEPTDQGIETRLDLSIASGRQGREGAAMKRLIHDNNRGRFDAILVAVQARDFYRSLIGFATGIAEKCILHAAYCGQFVG